MVSATFAALSIVLAGVLTSEVAPWLTGLVSLLFVPQAAKAGLFVWLGEYQRSQRAGRHLAVVETTINELLGVDGDRGMHWESALTARGTHMSLPYRATVVFTIGVGWVAALLGVALVASSLGDWQAVVFLAVAVPSVVGLEWWFLDVFLRAWATARTGEAPSWPRWRAPLRIRDGAV